MGSRQLWVPRCCLHTLGLTSDSLPSERLAHRMQTTWVKTLKIACWVGSGPSDPLRHVLLPSCLLLPSAMQALEDWQKSLNWRWVVTPAPIATFANLRSRCISPWAVQQWCCAERACKSSLLGWARTALAAMACPLFGRLPPCRATLGSGGDRCDLCR